MADVSAHAPTPRRSRVAWNGRLIFGLLVLGSLVFLAAFAGWIAPKDPLAQDLLYSYLPPSFFDGGEPGYLLGTDSLGRDVLSRLIHAARPALIVAAAAAGGAALLGTILGLLAGWFGGWIDQIISRLIEIWMSFPPVLLSIVLVAVLGTGLHSVIIAIIVIDWTRFARVVRSETLVQKQMDYVASAVSFGLGRGAILAREVVPNILPILLTLFTLEMGIAVVVEAILSFVGLSVSGDTATWGGMIAEGRQVIHQAWWVMALPIGALIVVVLGFNLLGDGLRQACDPVMRR